MEKIRVLIADDHGLVRSGLRALLSLQPHIEVVGEAENGIVVEEMCRRLLPDVVLMDLTMPARGGISAAEDVRSASPRSKLLVLTMHEDEVYARQAARAGAAGYVLKKALATELISAIERVHRGGRYVSASMEKAFSETQPAEPRCNAERQGPSLLSRREREVLGLIALGHTNAEIGSRLHISEKTVETHRAHILEKLGLRTRADLVRFAIEHGLMTP
jgi:DNA-binding NarL/FixJ family response regulator